MYTKDMAGLLRMNLQENKQVYIQLTPSANNVTLLAVDVQQSIDISCPPGPQQQTRRSGVRRPNDGTDGQTDGRTPDRYIQ